MVNSSEIPDEFLPIEKPSSFGELLGPIYERKEEDGSFTRALQVEDKHTNLGGVVHGGVLMAFVDVIMGTISYRHARRPGASIRIVSDFIAPARIGDWLEGRGEVVKATRSVVFARGHLKVEERTILTASGTYKLQGRPHSGC
jgi:uncharacterized protein (TIGR00369 family)